MLFKTNRKKITQLEQRIKLIETKLEQRIKLIETQLALDEVENTQEFVQALYKKIERKKKEQEILIKNKAKLAKRKR